MSKPNIVADLVNLTSTCLEFDYETLDEIFKHKKSNESFNRIKVESRFRY